MTGFVVREARVADAPRVRELMEQLGYDVPVSDIAERLAYCGHERQVFVAVDPRGIVVAWVAVSLPIWLIAGMRAEIEGFVVDESVRGKGAGRLLLERAEAWARASGCTKLRLLSNVIRENAHAFYEKHDYSILKTEHVFEKSL